MSITITKKFQQPMFEMCEEHFHTGRSEIFYLISGTRRFFAGCTIYTMSAGDLMFIPSGCLHRTAYNDTNSAERIVLTFPDNTSPYISHFYKETLFHTGNNIIEEMLEEILSEQDRADVYSEEVQKLIISRLIITLMRMPSENTSIDLSALHPDDKRIQQTAEYICQHFSEKFTLQRASEYAGFSRTYFSQKFKTVTGFGFNDYLNAVRIRHAVYLLINTDLSITETAYQCGFNDSNYFGGVFKRSFNMSPREYRKLYMSSRK